MVEAGAWHASLEAARDEGFTFFDWLSAVDRTYDEGAPGFDITAHLLDLGTPRALRGILLVTRVADGEQVDSVTSLFAGAAWHERETFEMFGIDFAGFDDGSGMPIRPRRWSPSTSPASVAATSSSAANGGTRPYMRPSGSTSTVGAKRHPPRWLACQTRSGVAGIWIFSAARPRPAWSSASTIAFITAGVAPIVPSSPTPLTPSGLSAHGIEVSNSVRKATPMSARGTA